LSRRRRRRVIRRPRDEFDRAVDQLAAREAIKMAYGEDALETPPRKKKGLLRRLIPFI